MDTWQIVKKPSYERHLERLSKDYERIDELSHAIDWALSRNPKRFTSIIGKDYIWKTPKRRGFPQVRVFYQIDEKSQTVYLLAIAEVVDEVEY